MRSSRLKLIAAVMVAAFAGALAPATASADHNAFANAEPLNLNTVVNDNNVGTSIEPPEAYTYNTSLCEGRAMGGTLWWKFTGNGRPVTVSTKGSTFDTVLAVWANGNTLSGCSDDVLNDDRFRHSEIRMNTTSGTTYWVQVGGLCLTFATDGGREDCMTWRQGNVSVAAWVAPGNDTLSGATAIHDHHQQSFETRGAREDGEGAPTCGTSPFGKTVWFRFDAPSKGKVHLTASGFDTVMAVHDGASGAFLRCHDDPQVSGPSHVVVDATPGQTFFVQVGGYRTGRAAAAGTVDMLAVWEQDTDWDDDGAAGLAYGGGDCQDENGAVKPGIDDIPNNDVDDNCDSYKDFDRDGDGYRVTAPVRNPKPTNWDCDDRPGIGARIHPGTRDIRGNRLDEDCSGKAAKALGLPSSITDTWAGKPAGAAVTSMKVKPALKRSKVKISCSGGGCPFRSKNIPVRRRTKALVLSRLFKGHVLRSGTRLVVKVLPPTIEWIGRSESYRIRGSAVSSSKACWNVRGRKVRCPS